MNTTKPNCDLPEASVVSNNEGIKYILFNTHDCISLSIRHRGEFERILFQISEYFLSSINNGRVLDIGSNIGTFTIPLAKKYRHLYFDCFEIQKPVYYQLCGNIVLNSLSNVTAHQIGLSNKFSILTTRLPNYKTEDNVGCFSLDNNVNQSIRGDDFSFQGCEQPVSLNKLDSLSLFPENIPVVLIKIDVEGFEKEVLEGGIGLIVHNNYPPIIFETWEYDWYAEKKQIIFNFLENLGYVIQSLGMNNIAQHNTRNVIYFSIN